MGVEIRLPRRVLSISGPPVSQINVFYYQDSSERFRMTGGELFDRIVKKTGPLPEDVAKRHARTILEVIEYLHGRNKTNSWDIFESQRIS